jgi:hypothetical protein
MSSSMSPLARAATAAVWDAGEIAKSNGSASIAAAGFSHATAQGKMS